MKFTKYLQVTKKITPGLFIVLASFPVLNVYAVDCKVSSSLSNGRMIIQRQLDRYVEVDGKTYFGLMASSYFDTFGPNFESLLMGLKAKQRWLDSGAGARLAIIRYHELKKLDGLESASTIALNHEKIETSVRKSHDRFLNDFKHTDLEGRFLEEIPYKELGELDLITDLSGPASYSNNFAKVFKKYIRSLKKGGSLFLKDSSNVIFVSANGEQIGFEAFLNRVKGIEVLVGQRIQGEILSYQIIKTSKKLSFPKTELVSYETGNLPKIVHKFLD